MGERTFTEKLKLASKFKFAELYKQEDPGELYEDVPLSVMLENIIGIDDVTWGSLYAFPRDPIAGRISREDKQTYTKRAIECGVNYAKTLKAQYPAASCRELVDILGIEYSEPHSKNGQWRAVFAEFEEPNKLRVFSDYVMRSEESLIELNELLRNAKIKDVLIGHELFHYFEKRDKDSIYTINEKIKLWDIKILKNSSSIMCLSEIAAMSFCKELLELNYSPFVFDIILTYSVNPKLAKKLYYEIMQY